MYVYDEHDKRLVRERAAQLRDQVRRRALGELTEEEFRPLRLQNGLYLQLHAYMLRIAIPYGLLSSTQLRKLAHVTRTYDRGYAHFTTRQNLQLNWPNLEDVPTILDELASVEMHAIQTSGNCIRNVTADPYAGVAADEEIDPRPYCEILRQWSTFHPELAALPRKFKLALTGAADDRAAIAVHDIGIRVVKNEAGEVGFDYFAGGGQGRTPLLAERLRAFVPERDLLSYTEAVLRVYNLEGRRDNKYKARIKVLVKETGIEEFRRRVEAEHAKIKDDPALVLDAAEVARMKRYFVPPAYEKLAPASFDALVLGKDRDLARWAKGNLTPHRVPGYAIVHLSLKSKLAPPGDVTADQMDAVADLADRFSMGRIVVTHRQNLVLTDVAIRDLREVHAALSALGFATPNVDRVTDMITCPGLDYCDLANARSIPIAEDITRRFDDLDWVFDVGPLTLNISGCINACGHHHVGNIGILGIDKQGEEFYQVMLGGSGGVGVGGAEAAIGRILGRALSASEVAPAIERIVRTYVALRTNDEETPSIASATSPSRKPSMALIRKLQNKYALADTDPWTVAGEAIDDGADVIVPLARLETAVLARRGRTGVRLPNDQGVEPVLPFVSRLALIAIEFPKHVDGRGYSLARLLRERHGYTGELRAVGNVLRDNLLFMARCGFDAFELDPKYGPGGLDPIEALRAFDDFDVFYQAASDVRLPLWKRVSRA